MMGVAMAASEVGGQIAGYYASVESLQVKAENPNAVVKTTASTVSDVTANAPLPLRPYVTYIPSVVLFVAALWIQLHDGVQSTKHLVVAVMIACFAAVIPAALLAISASTGLAAHAAPGDMPRMVHVERSGDQNVLITWQTQNNLTGAARVDPVPFDGTNPTILIADNGEQKYMHLLRVSGLLPGTTYGVEILSGTHWYNENGQPVTFTFR